MWISVYTHYIIKLVLIKKNCLQNEWQNEISSSKLKAQYSAQRTITDKENT